MPMGCVTRAAANEVDLERTYVSTEGRAVDHVKHLARYWGVHPHMNGWQGEQELPANHLNEFGPRGFNYFRVTQTDELRQKHAVKLSVAKRSPMLRAKEAGFHLNPATGYSTSSLVSALSSSQSLARKSFTDEQATGSPLKDLEAPAFSHYAPQVRHLPPPKELLRSRPSMQELFVQSQATS